MYLFSSCHHVFLFKITTRGTNFHKSFFQKLVPLTKANCFFFIFLMFWSAQQFKWVTIGSLFKPGRSKKKPKTKQTNKGARDSLCKHWQQTKRWRSFEVVYNHLRECKTVRIIFFFKLESLKHVLIKFRSSFSFTLLTGTKCTVISSHASLPLRHQLRTESWLGKYSSNLWRKPTRVKEPLSGVTHTWILNRPATPRDADWDQKPRLDFSSYTKGRSVFVVFFPA